MDAALEGAVELLERSLAYTRVALADVTPRHLDAPTPCAGWTLRRLLAHMDDALDAFTEAASGVVAVSPVAASADRVDSLREKACALLGAWTAARPAAVGIGDRRLDAPLLVATAALEVAVHGWDVAQATGRGSPLPPDLAGGLIAVAEQVVGPADRGSRFGAPSPVAAASSPSDRLLGWTGRTTGWMTGPVGRNQGEPPSPGVIAS